MESNLIRGIKRIDLTSSKILLKNEREQILLSRKYMWRKFAAWTAALKDILNVGNDISCKPNLY